MIQALWKRFKPVQPVRKTRLSVEGFEERNLPAALVDLPTSDATVAPTPPDQGVRVTGTQVDAGSAVSVYVGEVTAPKKPGVTNAVFIDGTPLTLDTRNGPGGDDFALGSGVTQMGGPLFGYEYPWSDNARWGWSGSLLGDGTEYALGTVVKVGGGLIVGGTDTLSPIPLGNPPDAFFRDSQRFALGRVAGNVVGIVYGVNMTVSGFMTVGASGAVEFVSVGTATPIAAPVAAIGVIEIGAGIYMMVNGANSLSDNIRRFPDGGGGGGGTGAPQLPTGGKTQSTFDLESPRASVPEMVNAVRQLTDSSKAGQQLKLTLEQVKGLTENARRVAKVYWDAKASGTPRSVESLQNQLNLDRWRYISQAPEARAILEEIARDAGLVSQWIK